MIETFVDAPVGTVYSQYIAYDRMGEWTYTKCGPDLWVDPEGSHFTDLVMADALTAGAMGPWRPGDLQVAAVPAPPDLSWLAGVTDEVEGKIRELLEDRCADLEGPDPGFYILAKDIMKLVRGEA